MQFQRYKTNFDIKQILVIQLIINIKPYQQMANYFTIIVTILY